MRAVTVLIIGAGSRGHGYSRFAKEYPDKMRVVGVAEPREFYRERMVCEHGIAPENAVSSWEQFVNRPKLADAVIISTPDAMHTEPSIAFAEKGYAILLEKPMAPSADECRRIVAAVQKNEILFAVCHVLRYTVYTKQVKKLVDSGIIGDVVSIQHLEPVGYWHQAHSFVRGNWRNEKESSFMLLAKSCHDIDWISYIMGVPCKSVSSFGSLYHFRKEQKPKNAGFRCVSCACEQQCPYSALRFYMGRLKTGQLTWPLNVISSVVTEENVMKALREGPYGRCVYECDNDVVDNQAVNMAFDGGRTASFTMTAFGNGGRRTSIFGTKGMLYGEGAKIRIFEFLTERETIVDTKSSTLGSILDGHGGGDGGLMEAFINALATGDKSKIISGPKETLESHLIVFGAEEARRKNIVVELNTQKTN